MSVFLKVEIVDGGGWMLMTFVTFAACRVQL